jgi:putative peptidoglycan lipid II flippase
MKRATLIIIGLTLISKIIGIGRDIALSYEYGANYISDAYLISFTIPGVVFAFLGTGIATIFIPIYTEIQEKKDIESANAFTNNLISILIIICTIIVIIGFSFSEAIVKLFAIGFDQKTMDLAVKFTQISMFGIYISVLIHVFSSYLNIKKNFHIPALMGIPFNVIIVVSVIVSADLNLLYLPIGIIVALIAQLIFLMPFVRKQGFKFKFTINKKDVYTKRLLLLSMPVIFGVSIDQINVLVDRSIASVIVEGGISALTYANRLNLFIQGIFVVSIATAMYPMISTMAATGNMKGLKKALINAVNGVILLVTPATIGAIVLAEPIVMFLFGRGEFDTKAISLTSNALFYYSIGMVAVGIREIFTRAFYALQDTRTPMINAAIALIINIILNLILSKYMGLSGLALATSISIIIGSFLLFFSLRKKIGTFGMKKVSKTLIKVLFISLVMGLIARLLYFNLSPKIGSEASLIVSIMVGAISYLSMLFLMKVEGIDVIVKNIKGKLILNNNK